MKKNHLDNLEHALNRLTEFQKLPVITDRDKAGIIQAFEFSFELLWKALQERAEEEGANVASPKKAFQYALKSGFIKPTEEKEWVKVLEDRNLCSHTYDEELADAVYERITKFHTRALLELFSKIKKN